MKRDSFSEEEIIRILKAAEAAGNVRAVCRDHNVSEVKRSYGIVPYCESGVRLHG